MPARSVAGRYCIAIIGLASVQAGIVSEAWCRTKASRVEIRTIFFCDSGFGQAVFSRGAELAELVGGEEYIGDTGYWVRWATSPIKSGLSVAIVRAVAGRLADGPLGF